jgi:hypothetical protein
MLEGGCNSLDLLLAVVDKSRPLAVPEPIKKLRVSCHEL